MPAALYLRDGDLFVPTEHTRGPWDPEAQHGGPPAALLARALETAPAPAAMQLVRLGVRLLRPVPLCPVRARAEVVREGRRVQRVEAWLEDEDGGELCRATGLRIRSLDHPVGLAAGDGTLPPPPGPGLEPWASRPLQPPSFASSGVDLRFVRGSIRRPGPATVWVRLCHPVVEDEPPSPVMRAAAAADFGNGVSSLLDWETSLFINPELTIYLHRPPQGEWICLEARTELSPDGLGVAHSLLSDRQGSVGHALQALLVGPR
jgi:Acyl-CoA thioesterase C-terminal domain/Acyl-CoA thioesterase N-terminal domain